MSSDARAVVLERVRSAKGSVGDLAAAQSAWTQLPRQYRRGTDASREAVLELLEERLRDYDANVSYCAPGEESQAVAAALQAAAANRVVVPAGLGCALGGEFEVFEDAGLSAAELDSMHAVVTRSTLAIAETGSLVVQTVPGQGRRAATLVPDTHVCLVRVEDVVATVPEAFDRLKPTATLPTTFISGPSATADIEMTRIKGVHGPRFLYVVLVG